MPYCTSASLLRQQGNAFIKRDFKMFQFTWVVSALSHLQTLKLLILNQYIVFPRKLQRGKNSHSNRLNVSQPLYWTLSSLYPGIKNYTISIYSVSKSKSRQRKSGKLKHCRCWPKQLESLVAFPSAHCMWLDCVIKLCDCLSKQLGYSKFL